MIGLEDDPIEGVWRCESGLHNMRQVHVSIWKVWYSWRCFGLEREELLCASEALLKLLVSHREKRNLPNSLSYYHRA